MFFPHYLYLENAKGQTNYLHRNKANDYCVADNLPLCTSF